ncbi:MAG: sigma-70 family RNA polymerase sigma factor [Desulfitobacteriaceae bacterium]|nr:sigma-70 family RNA polymerase sigma factor [Desulfitobacteriaceae bacterium]
MRFKLLGKNETHHDIAEFIFKNYYKTAYYTAYKYCDDHSMAEEAAQEAIFQAIKNFDQLKDPGKLESWIKAIARNTVFNMLKAMVKRVTYNVIDFEDMQNDPLTIVESEEIIREIRQIIRNLDESSYAIIVLFYYKKIKIKEISSILNISEGTIKSVLHRSRNKVKRELIKRGTIDGLAEGGVDIDEPQRQNR